MQAVSECPRRRYAGFENKSTLPDDHIKIFFKRGFQELGFQILGINLSLHEEDSIVSSKGVVFFFEIQNLIDRIRLSAHNFDQQ